VSEAGRTRVGAYALCHDDARRVLLCRLAERVGAGSIWILPGGGIDFGESPGEAVVRELAEESGYDGEVVALVGVFDHVYAELDEGRPLHSVEIVYRVRITGGALRDEVDGSTDRCAWFGEEEMAGLPLGLLVRRVLADAAEVPAGRPADAEA
jgi:ADP-ribose pyrophosphatase YjhB (NUDIX family)